MSREPERIQAVDRAVAILTELAHLGVAGLSQLAAAVDLPTSTVERQLATLEARGWAERINDKWTIGKGVAALWASYQRRMMRELAAARQSLASTAIPAVTYGATPEEWSQ